MKISSSVKFTESCRVALILTLLLSNVIVSFRVKNRSHSKIKKIAFSLKDTQTLSINSDMYSDSGKSDRSDVFEGSVLIDAKSNLSFSSHFLDKDYSYNDKKIIARARYTKSLKDIGWSKLYVETFDNISPEIQSWAAGFLEGKLTAQEILFFYKNLVGIHQEEAGLLDQVFDYYNKVENFIRRKTSKTELQKLNDEDLKYWTSVAMIQAQTDGLLNGYNSIMKSNKFTLDKIYFINADGEVPELIEVFKQKNRSSNYYSRFKQRKPAKKFSNQFLQTYFGTTDGNKLWANLMMNSHCSAVIKLVSDDYDEGAIKDIMIGHTTWDSYSEMQRIYKIYKFSFTLLEKQENPIISFSSYAGTLTSTDDFYLLNSGLVVLETTIEILDRSLYNTNLPSADEHVPNYIRISVANRLAKDGKQWTDIFKKNNSGTYNSQWMIINLNKIRSENKQTRYNQMKNHYTSLFNSNIFNFKQFTNDEEYEGPNAGLFYLLEQIPGMIQVKDMTPVLLRRKYWGSFNRPFFPNIYRVSGYEEMAHRFGNTYSFERSPRALLIKNSIESVKNVEDLKRLMQSNEDINGNIGPSTLSPRFDLVSRSRVSKPSGGIDSKITNLQMGKNLEVLAISGPTHQNSKPFNWDDWDGQNYPHYGLPKNWDFDWVKMDVNSVKNE